MATNAFEQIRAAFEAYGLQTLVPRIQEFMVQGITDPASIILMLRSTPEYKARFPAMEALNQKGRGFSEADYINYERNAAEQEQRYGFPRGFLTDPGRVQQMLENDVSASELNERARLNAAVSINAPQELKDSLRRLYGLDESALAAYYLDPDNAVPYLEKQYAASSLAGQAARQQLDIDRQLAEDLVAQGITEAAGAQGFQQVAGLRGLQTGFGEQATQDEIIRATFGDQAASEKVERVVKGRTAEFSTTGGGAAESQQGVVGLGRG
jgi:hypothetical protein